MQVVGLVKCSLGKVTCSRQSSLRSSSLSQGVDNTFVQSLSSHKEIENARHLLRHDGNARNSLRKMQLQHERCCLGQRGSTEDHGRIANPKEEQRGKEKTATAKPTGICSKNLSLHAHVGSCGGSNELLGLPKSGHKSRERKAGDR
eukprot:4351944-Pleurochrysis_carterae.AAC.1